jgi:excisionase family DNA binding protein
MLTKQTRTIYRQICAVKNKFAKGGAEIMERLLGSVAEAAEALNVSRDTIWRLLKSKQMKSVRVGKRVLISLVEIHRMASEGNWAEGTQG